MVTHRAGVGEHDGADELVGLHLAGAGLRVVSMCIRICMCWCEIDVCVGRIIIFVCMGQSRRVKVRICICAYAKHAPTSSFMRPLKTQCESPETMLHWYMLLCPPLRLHHFVVGGFVIKRTEGGSVYTAHDTAKVNATQPCTNQSNPPTGPNTQMNGLGTYRWWMKEWMSSSCSSLVTVRPSVCVEKQEQRCVHTV